MSGINKQMSAQISKVSIFVIIFFLSCGVLPAQQGYTPYSLVGGVSVDMTYYLSDFKQLPGIYNSSRGFGGAVGISHGVYVGAEYKLSKSFLPGRTSAGIHIGYTDLSAEFSEENFIGYIIYNDDYTSATVEHLLNADIQMLYLEPRMTSYPFDFVDLGIELSGRFGLLTGKTFAQSENLLSPGDIYFENGKRVRNEASGDIPDAASFYIGISAGVRYDVYTFSDIILQPFMRVNYGLTDMVSGIDWNAGSIDAGIQLAWNIAKSPMVPAAEPPPPPLPLPPALKDMELAIKVETDGRELEESETVYLEKEVKNYYYVHTVLPIVFFEQNSAEVPELSSIEKSDIEDLQKKNLIVAAEYLKENPEVGVIVRSWYYQEDRKVAQERLDRIKEFLTSMDISSERITNAEPEEISDRDLKYEDREQEYRRAELEFTNGLDVLTVRGLERSEEVCRGKMFSISTDVSVNDIKADVISEVIMGGEVVQSSKELQTVFELPGDCGIISAAAENGELLFTARAEDFQGGEAEAKLKVLLKEKYKSREDLYNLVANDFGSDSVSQYILGYCRFDEPDLYAVNEEVKKIVEEALSLGKIIQIFPLTDKYGSREHNARLSLARANAATVILGLSRQDVEVIIPRDFLFSNETPYGRLLNRSVAVRILNK